MQPTEIGNLLPDKIQHLDIQILAVLRRFDLGLSQHH
jgi:hypothetical protein